MNITEYTSQEIMKVAVDSDRDIRAKVLTILRALDIELDQLGNGLMNQFSEYVVDEYMEGYRKAELDILGKSNICPQKLPKRKEKNANT